MRWGDLSIKWKIMLISLTAPVLIGILLSVQRINDIREGAKESILSKSRAVVMMAESTRENMANKLQKGVMKPFEELKKDKDKLLEAVPIVTAMRVANKKS